MAEENPLLDNIYKRLKENTDGNRIHKKDAFAIFGRSIRFDKEISKITLNEMKKSGMIEFKKGRKKGIIELKW